MKSGPNMSALWIYLSSQMSLKNVKLFFSFVLYFKSPGNYMLLEDRNCFGLCTYVQFFVLNLLENK